MMRLASGAAYPQVGSLSPSGVPSSASSSCAAAAPRSHRALAPEVLQVPPTPTMPIKRLEELAMTSVKELHQMQAVVEEMRETEREHMTRIAALQQAASSSQEAERNLPAFEEMASRYANRIAQLEAKIGDLTREKEDSLQRIAEWQEHLVRTEQLAELTVQQNECIARLEADNEEMKRSQKSSFTEEELEDLAMTLKRRNVELEDVIKRMTVKEQELLATVRRLETDRGRPTPGEEELERLALDSAKRERELKSEVDRLRLAEQGHAAEVTSLKQTLMSRSSAPVERDLEGVAKTHAAILSCESLMGKMKAVEQEQLSQLAGGTGAATPATTASHGEPQEAAEGAGVEGLALAQAQRMEEMAKAQAQRIAEQEDEIGKLRHAEQGYLARISELQQQMEALAKRQQEANIEQFGELEGLAMTHAQRNIELEEEIRRMCGADREKAARLCELEAELRRARGAEADLVHRGVELEAEMRRTKATEAEFVQRNVELEDVVSRMARASQDQQRRFEELRLAAEASEKKAEDLEEQVQGEVTRCAALEATLRETRSALDQRKEAEHQAAKLGDAGGSGGGADRQGQLQSALRESDTLVRSLRAELQSTAAENAELRATLRSMSDQASAGQPSPEDRRGRGGHGAVGVRELSPRPGSTAHSRARSPCPAMTGGGGPGAGASAAGGASRGLSPCPPRHHLRAELDAGSPSTGLGAPVPVSPRNARTPPGSSGSKESQARALEVAMSLARKERRRPSSPTPSATAAAAPAAPPAAPPRPSRAPRADHLKAELDESDKQDLMAFSRSCS